MNFTKHKRKGLSEMIPVKEFIANGGDLSKVSLSSPDSLLKAHDLKKFEQGFVARNPVNHEDMWYVAKDYYDQNLEPAEEQAKSNLTFGQAIEAAKQGRRVARIGWNGKGLFVFMQIPAVIQEEIIPIMQSLPQSVKDEFAKRGGSISYQNQFGIVYPDNSIHGWTPSPSDTLAEDWVVLD